METITEEEEEYVEYIPVHKRRAMEHQKLLARNGKKAKGLVPGPCPVPSPSDVPLDASSDSLLPSSSLKPSLLVQSTQLNQSVPEVSPTEQLLFQEQELLSHLSDRKTLMSVRELAKGITYTEPLWTGWKPPLSLRRMSPAKCQMIRKQWHILVEGDEVPPPIKTFQDMRFPSPVLKTLKEKGIVQPTPIQVQGMPVILSGRDMIGIAFTGSGKTLVFVLPMIMVAMQEEGTMPIEKGEGPIGLVVCPSRELARQTYEVVEHFLTRIKDEGYPEIRALLCIGGVDMRAQVEVVNKGVHIVVATPGRLKDMLAKKKMKLDNCR